MVPPCNNVVEGVVGPNREFASFLGCTSPSCTGTIDQEKVFSSHRLTSLGMSHRSSVVGSVRPRHGQELPIAGGYRQRASVM